jgi:hypothetical protein
MNKINVIKKILISFLIILTFYSITSGQKPVEKSNKQWFDSLVAASQQPKDTSNTFWFDFGFGPFFCRDGYGPSIMGMEFSYAKKKSLFSLKVDANIDISGWFNDHFPNQEFYNLGIMYGRVKSNGKKQYSYSIGIGLIDGEMRGKYLYDESSTWIISYHNIVYENIKFRTINIPLEFQRNYLPFPHFGIGLNAFANINTKLISGGVLIKFRWGKLK